MKIVVISDSHWNSEAIGLIRKKETADVYVHCGDYELPEEALEGWIAVAGNMDDARKMPMEQELRAEGLSILIKHGHDVISGRDPDYRALAGYASGYDAVLFGHTHVYYDNTVLGVRLLNPGSVFRNRDGSPAGYMVLNIENRTIHAEKKLLLDLLLCESNGQSEAGGV